MRQPALSGHESRDGVDPKQRENIELQIVSFPPLRTQDEQTTRRLEFGDQSGAFRAMGEQSRVGSLIWQFRRRLPRYEGPLSPSVHRAGMGIRSHSVKPRKKEENRLLQKRTSICPKKAFVVTSGSHFSVLKHCMKVSSGKSIWTQWCHVNT